MHAKLAELYDPRDAGVTPLLFTTLMLLVQIVLLNLLIAIMANSYSKVNDESTLAAR